MTRCDGFFLETALFSLVRRSLISAFYSGFWLTGGHKMSKNVFVNVDTSAKFCELNHELKVLL
jgi:hypothetical protein